MPARRFLPPWAVEELVGALCYRLAIEFPPNGGNRYQPI
jgi:hypothetical protein